MMPAIYIALV